jgi:hypothetical protein
MWQGMAWKGWNAPIKFIKMSIRTKQYHVFVSIIIIDSTKKLKIKKIRERGRRRLLLARHDDAARWALARMPTQWFVRVL